jgi:hypothetical protein
MTERQDNKLLALEAKIEWIGEHVRDPKGRRKLVRWIEQ